MAACQLKKISSNTYWFTPDGRTDRPSLLAVVGEKGTLVLDAGASPVHAQFFLAELAKQNVPPPRMLAISHWHWDHIFGTSAYGEIPVITHRKTAAEIALQASYDWSDAALDKRVEDGLEIDFCRVHIKLEMPDRSDLKLVLPDIVFDDELTIDLGDVTCLLKHVGGDHARDHIIAYIPQDRLIFLADCLGENLYHDPRCYTTAEVYPLFDKVLAYDADTYIWGHGDELESRAQIEDFASLLRRVGGVVDNFGNNRDAILKELESLAGRAPNDDECWAVDSFLGGL